MICPKCGLEGKRRAYISHDYPYIRFVHWDGMESWHCHIGYSDIERVEKGA